MDKVNFIENYDAPQVEIMELEIEQAVLHNSSLDLDPTEGNL